MHPIIENIEKIYAKYGKNIKNNRHLILAYFKEIDGVRWDSSHISTQDFLNKTTDISDILNAKMMLEVMKKER